MRALRKGHRGPDVERWRRFLVDQGLLSAESSDLFDEAADEATRAFQSREQLAADGVVGPKTLGRARPLGLETYRRVRDNEVTPELSAEAKRILKAHWQAPLGSEYHFEVEGQRYIGRIEQHYHPPGGPMKPWGNHSGVSLFVAVTPGPAEPVHDETSV